MDLTKALMISTAGMKAQGTRLQVISENMANANSAPALPGQDPYRRKIVSFHEQFSQASGVNLVSVNNVSRDKSDFVKKYDPGHPSADAQGYVTMPNVNMLIEAMDMREAETSYQANLSMVEVAKSMVSKTVDLLRT